jgi:type II secretory pathway pseudopilin PulG
MLKQSQGGFTLIEITIAILILTAAVLGIAASTGRMIAPTGEAEIEFKALQIIEDRLAAIRLEPRYGVLDSLFSGTQSTLPGLPGYTRTTLVERHEIPQTGGKILDYTEVVVTVSGPGLATDRFRKLVLGAP